MQTLLIFLLINQHVYANNNNIAQNANLEKLIDNYYNLYLSNSIVDGNMSYYTFFQPKTTNSPDNIWSGMLVAFFIDADGNLREDSNSNLRLDSADAIVSLSYDLTTNNIKVTKSVAHKEEFKITDYSITDVSSVWDTDKLATDNSTTLGAKEYHTISAEKRYIFTQIPENLDILINSACKLNHQYFNVDTLSCNKLINYLYGKTASTQRSKIKDVSATEKKISNLGDIVHAEVVVAGYPKENYDYLYQDTSYAEFKKLYQDRRKVIYVGANDGMIHAFNAGFYNATDTHISTTGANNEAPHALGSELWAYAPLNLLPYLKELTAKNYNHKYFVDGSLQIVDAQIFSADNNHPNGWGTVLIVATGLGGDFISLPIKDNKQNFSSSYILLDVTNPEIPPKIIAEIRHEQLGFTLAKPVIIKRQVFASGDTETYIGRKHDWYMVFASGPKNNPSLSTFTNNYLKIFIYNLHNKKFVAGFSPKVTNFNNCYAGDMQSVDWDNTNEDSCIYFGALHTSNNIVSHGSILRLKLKTPITESMVSTLATNLKPIVKAPLLVKDKHDFWVFAGSGRLLTEDDASTINNQFLYGIREPLDNKGNLLFATVDAKTLVDVTNVEISTNDEIRSKNSNGVSTFYIDGDKITDFNQLEKSISNRYGWKRNLDAENTDPGYLQLQPQRLSSLILFSEFKPKLQNYFVGNRYLHVLHYKTGTASIRYKLAAGNEQNNEEITSKDIAITKFYAGIGYSSSNYIKITTSINHGIKIIIPDASEITISADANTKSSKANRLSWRRIK